MATLPPPLPAESGLSGNPNVVPTQQEQPTAPNAEAQPIEPQPHVTVARHILDALGGSGQQPMDWAKSILAGGLSAAANVGTVPAGGGALTGITRTAAGLRQQGREDIADKQRQAQVQQEMQLKQKADARAEQELQIHLEDTKVQRAMWTAQTAGMIQNQNQAAEKFEEWKKEAPLEYGKLKQEYDKAQEVIDQTHGEMIGLVEAVTGKPISSFPLVTNSSELTEDHAKQAASGAIFPVHNGESHAAGEDKVGAYLIPGQVWDDTIKKPWSFENAEGDKVTAQQGTTLATLAGVISGKMKAAQDKQTLAMNQLDQAAKAQAIKTSQSEAAKNYAEAELARSNIGAGGPQTDILGGTFTPPTGGFKETNKIRDSYKKDADSLAQTEGTYNQFQSVLNDINAGKEITGAQSIIALFNAIGISAEPLKGKGFRINNNTVQEHVDRLGLEPKAVRGFERLKNGEIISSQQIKDYASIAMNARRDAYVNKINEARAAGIDPSFLLPRGNGKPLDVNTGQIFYDAASGATPQEKSANALKALKQMGWQ